MTPLRGHAPLTAADRRSTGRRCRRAITDIDYQENS
jgi:hypothetical protein